MQISIMWINLNFNVSIKIYDFASSLLVQKFHEIESFRQLKINLLSSQFNTCICVHFPHQDLVGLDLQLLCNQCMFNINHESSITPTFNVPNI